MSEQTTTADDVVRTELERVMVELKAAGAELGLTPVEVMSCLVVQASVAKLVTNAAAELVAPGKLRAATRFLYRALADIEIAGGRIEDTVGPDAGDRAIERIRGRRKGGAA